MAEPAQRGGTAGAAGGTAGTAGGTAGTAGGTAGAEGRHSRHRGAAQPAQRGGTAGTEVRHSRRNRGWGARRAQRGGGGAEATVGIYADDIDDDFEVLFLARGRLSSKSAVVN